MAVLEAGLSIAIIARNEEAHLPELIESLKPLEAERVIVDTGSADDTAAIARMHADRFETIPWQDDFAAARNASLDLCTCEWIFVIDADERVDAPACDEIMNFVNGPRCAVRYCTRNYTNSHTAAGFFPAAGEPVAHGFAGWYPSYKVRLFPNRRDIRFHGVVHEMAEPDIRRANIPIFDADHPIHHYPHERSDERQAEKRLHYLRLGKLKCEAGPDDPKAHIEFGNQLAELGEYESAIAELREGLRLDPSITEAWNDLGGVLHLTERNDEAEKALRIALRMNEASFRAWRNLAAVLLSRGDAEGARDAIYRAKESNPDWEGAEEALKTIDRGQGGINSDEN